MSRRMLRFLAPRIKYVFIGLLVQMTAHQQRYGSQYPYMDPNVHVSVRYASVNFEAPQLNSIPTQTYPNSKSRFRDKKTNVQLGEKPHGLLLGTFI